MIKLERRESRKYMKKISCFIEGYDPNDMEFSLEHIEKIDEALYAMIETVVYSLEDELFDVSTMLGMYDDEWHFDDFEDELLDCYDEMLDGLRFEFSSMHYSKGSITSRIIYWVDGDGEYMTFDVTGNNNYEFIYVDVETYASEDVFNTYNEVTETLFKGLDNEVIHRDHDIFVKDC